ncbi:uncharacterized protein KIAA0930 homolog isoform X2 [Lineus longissimus]|uniref:uncharacterized protein KIAA0930 homolog isoform X2 n=1 Tax=Lineus longissimus TaxID=88925 RepID=UPI00315DA641
MKHSSSFQKMLEAIAEERERDMRKLRLSNDFIIISPNHFWPELFRTHFVEPGDRGADELRDDLLFFVRKTPTNSKIRNVKTDIEVYRRESKNLPSFEEKYIDWEETVYLNLILQQFEYTVTCAICSRTGEKELQILKKFSQRVYASPSRRQMDSKGTEEEITYPNIFFTVDNFEEIFADCIVRDSEMVCVELIATDKYGEFQGVLFLGSIRYDALKRVYDARNSMSSRFVQRMSMGWFQGHRRVEFVRMRGPGGKGHAEMAVSKLKGAPETPDTENFPINDFEDDQDQNQYNQRRMSDPSSMLGSWMKGSFKKGMRKSRSETESVDSNLGYDGCTEVEAAHPEDELATTENYDGFLGSTFGQAWHWFKERKRASCQPLNSYLTYVTLPWHRIIADTIDIWVKKSKSKDVCDRRQKPTLTF